MSLHNWMRWPMKILDSRANLRTVHALAERRARPDPAIEERTKEIINQVRMEGDEALTTLTRQLDSRFIDSLGLRIIGREVEQAYRQVNRSFLAAIRVAKRNITRFHSKQFQRSWDLQGEGMRLTQRYRPLSRVGIYIPGGKAAYPSTVLMNAIPARIAGVEHVVMTTPCSPEGKISPEVLVAAGECGITEMYRVGGAQAIAALAYGTESIMPVEKITGPGNAYVAAAKRLVFGVVGIDMIAGPTEIVIFADASARPAFVAADMIAQAEHDELAAAIVVTTSVSLAGRIEREVARQLESAPRRNIARMSLEGEGLIIVVRGLSEGIEIVNRLAPEHLEIMARGPRRIAARIRNAGSIFLGPWSCEAFGDYLAGPNHTLPTSGSSRFSSPLSVADFMKFSNIIEISHKAFERLGPSVETLALAEGLHGHAASVAVRRGEA